MGRFAQPVPVTCRLEDVPFLEVLRRVREAADAAERWQDYCPPRAGLPGANPAIAFEYGEAPTPCAANEATLSVFRVESPVGPLKALEPPFNLAGLPAALGPIPALGEHTDAILAELGYAPQRVAALRANGAVA